jgi:hypothetical protein
MAASWVAAAVSKPFTDGTHRIGVRCCEPILGQAQLEPTALSVPAMLLLAVCAFCPWALACW